MDGSLGGARRDGAVWRLGSTRSRGGARTRSLARHELLAIEASPGCNPVFDPLHELRSFQELMRRYGIRVCGEG